MGDLTLRAEVMKQQARIRMLVAEGNKAREIIDEYADKILDKNEQIRELRGKIPSANMGGFIDYLQSKLGIDADNITPHTHASLIEEIIKRHNHRCSRYSVGECVATPQTTQQEIDGLRDVSLVQESVIKDILNLFAPDTGARDIRPGESYIDEAKRYSEWEDDETSIVNAQLLKHRETIEVMEKAFQILADDVGLFCGRGLTYVEMATKIRDCYHKRISKIEEVEGKNLRLARLNEERNDRILEMGSEIGLFPKGGGEDPDETIEEFASRVFEEYRKRIRIQQNQVHPVNSESIGISLMHEAIENACAQFSMAMEVKRDDGESLPDYATRLCERFMLLEREAHTVKVAVKGDGTMVATEDSKFQEVKQEPVFCQNCADNLGDGAGRGSFKGEVVMSECSLCDEVSDVYPQEAFIDGDKLMKALAANVYAYDRLLTAMGDDVKKNPALLFAVCNKPNSVIWTLCSEEAEGVVSKGKKELHQFRDGDDAVEFMKFAHGRVTTGILISAPFAIQSTPDGPQLVDDGGSDYKYAEIGCS